MSTPSSPQSSPQGFSPVSRRLPRHLLRPKEILRHYQHITPAFLQERGLTGLLLDLDNTLVPYHSESESVTPEIAAWLRELEQAGIKVFVLSNATKERANRWCNRLNIQGVGLAGKPNPRTFRKALQRLKLHPQQVGMLGDQVFTDVLGGNLVGVYTMLVYPLSDNALPHTFLARRLERWVLRRYGFEWLSGK